MQAICVNSVMPDQAVVATNRRVRAYSLPHLTFPSVAGMLVGSGALAESLRWMRRLRFPPAAPLRRGSVRGPQQKRDMLPRPMHRLGWVQGLIFVDLFTEEKYESTVDSLWGELAWPRGGWAGSVATPPAACLPGAKERIGSSGGMDIAGYGGIGAWGLGWEDLEDMREGYVDPPATADSVFCRALASHPLRPLFLVGSDNTHVYLWEVSKGVCTCCHTAICVPSTPALLLQTVTITLVGLPLVIFEWAFECSSGDSVWEPQGSGDVRSLASGRLPCAPRDSLRERGAL